MIDSHCHLTDPRLFEQLDGVLARAAAAGVSRIITIGTDLADGQSCLALCEGRDNVRCAVGVHPNHSAGFDLAEMWQLRALHTHPAVLAVGEAGLDYHYDFAPRAHQAAVFEAQLQLAVDLGKPIVIHCRDAVDDALAMMKPFASVPAVFHCFTGTADEARRILDQGYLLGFTGAVTFKKADELRDVARFAPADRILVETDAPYLTPEPMRKQKTNEPALVVHTAAVVAQVRGVGVAELDEITSANAKRFFRWS